MHWHPFERSALATYPTKDAWDASALEITAAMLERWNLTAGEPFVGGAAASVLAVTQGDGSPAVLKVAYPHVEAVWEAVGLAAFGERLAPAVLRQDEWTWAMLLEAVDPGTPLADAVPALEAARIAGELHRSLAACPPPDGLPTLGEAMAGYGAVATDALPAQNDGLVALGVADLVEDAVHQLPLLAAGSAEQRLLHGDFNPGNILRSGDGWRVVDPKPLVGDPAFDLWPLVVQLGRPLEGVNAAAAFAATLSAVASASGCDAERIARWGFARTGLNVSWYVGSGERALAEREALALQAWATLLAG